MPGHPERAFGIPGTRWGPKGGQTIERGPRPEQPLHWSKARWKRCNNARLQLEYRQFGEEDYAAVRLFPVLGRLSGPDRWEERRVGQEGGSTFRKGWWEYH